MIKQGLKNYFKSLKYFFTPLGTMFLGMMIGFSVMIPGIFSALGSLIDGVKVLSENVHLDFEELGGQLWESVLALDWSHPIEAGKTMLSLTWLHNTLTQILTSILGTDFNTFQTTVTALIGTFSASVKNYIAIFLSFWILGFFAGYFLIKFLIRRNIAKRSIWKFLLANIINSVASTLLISLSVWLFGKWQPSVFVSVLVMLFLVGTFAFLEAYLLYGYKKVKFEKIVNVKNIGLYMLTNFLIFAITIGITLLAMVINVLMGFFVGLALITIAFIVISLNAESYVQEAVKKQTDSVAQPDKN